MKTAVLDPNRAALTGKGLFEENRSIINAAYAIDRDFPPKTVEALVKRAIEATYTRSIFQNMIVNDILKENNMSDLHFYGYRFVDYYGSMYFEIIGEQDEQVRT